MNMKKYCTDISIKKKASECTELPITDRLQYYSLHRVGKLSEKCKCRAKPIKRKDWVKLK